MFPYVRKPANLFLSLVMTFEVMFPSHLWAASAPQEEVVVQDPAVLAQNADDLSGLIANSKLNAAGLPKNAYGPDRFLLLEQQAFPRSYVGRSFSFAKNRREREIEKHQSRVDRIDYMIEQAVGYGAPQLDNACAAFADDEALKASVIEEAVVKHLNEGRRKDTPDFIWNAKGDPAKAACVRERLTALRDTWKTLVTDESQITDIEKDVPNITKAGAEEREQYFNWWEVRVDAIGADESVESVNMSRTADYVDKNRANSIVCAEPCSFNLVARSQKINAFHLKVKTLTTFGPYVVFTHEDSYDETTGLQYVSFIDLKTFNNLLGKEEIPVFTIPVTEFEGRVERLSVANKQLVMNDTHVLPLKKLIETSEIQRATFNIAANLLDVNETAAMMPYVESVDSYISKVISTELEQSRTAANDAKVAKVDFVNMGARIQQQLEESKNLGKLNGGKTPVLTAPEMAEIPAEMHTLLDSYAQELTKSQSLGKAMSDSNKLQQAQRGMGARIKALYHRVMAPVPNASLKIKRALVTVGMQENVDQGKFINQMVDRPWLEATLASAMIILAASPDTRDIVSEGALAMVNGIVDYLKFAATGLGEAGVDGTVATAKPIYSLFAPFYTLGREWGTLYDVYIGNGNLYKTTVGTGAFLSFVGLIYFIPHVIFNVHHVLYDRKMEGQEGKWKGFLDHQERFRAGYLQRLADDEAIRRGTKTTKVEGEEKAKVVFTDEENQIAREWIANAKANKKPPGMIMRLAGHTKKGFVALAQLPRKMFASGEWEVIRGKWEAVFDQTKRIAMNAAELASVVAEVATRPVRAVAKPVIEKLAPPVARAYAPVKPYVDKTGQVIGKTAGAIAAVPDALKTYGPAIGQLAFSGPAMELTLSRWAGGWNWFSGFRYTVAAWGTPRDFGVKNNTPFYIRPKPISIAVRVVLPNFFTTVVSRRGPAVTLPTALNGGLRTWERRDLTWYKEKVFGKAPIRSEMPKVTKPESDSTLDPQSPDQTIATSDLQLAGLLSPEAAGNVAEDAVADADKTTPASDSPIADPAVASELEQSYLEDLVTDSETREVQQEVERELNSSELKAIKDNFEDAILPVEDVIFKAAFDESLSRMADFLANKKDLENLFASAPIHSVIEKRVREMPVKVRTFLRLYSDRVYEATMREYLQEVFAAENTDESIDLTDLGDKPQLTALKRMLVATRTENQTMKPFVFDSARAGQIAHRIAGSEGFYESVRDQAQKGERSLENWRINRKYNLVADYDPSQNPSMKRYSVVQNRLKSPTALARAVRSEISKLIVTFPLNLGMHMLFTAAIFEGAFKPIQDSLWGPNSAFYFSWTAFYYSMGMGFTIGMMADAWNKLQVDARQDNLGDFGKVPTGEDAEKGFVRWYGKQWSAKNNSIMANWKYSNSLVFWNIPAFLVNMGTFSLVFSGRLDFSYMFAGFPITFGTPWGAFNQKIDQTFERASEYPARGIPDQKYMSHPEVQAYLSTEKQKLRNWYSVWSDLYGNVVGNLQGNIMYLPTSIGPRGFTRAMLGGYLLEELIVNKVIHPINYTLGNVPVLGHGVTAVTSVCERILTNGNVDLTKLEK